MQIVGPSARLRRPHRPRRLDAPPLGWPIVEQEGPRPGVAWAVECGARVAERQPQDDVRVMLDPAGHPFSLFGAPG